MRLINKPTMQTPKAVSIIAVIFLGLFLFSFYSGTEIDTVVDTSDWPVYRNEKYGFAIKYPPGWQFTDKETDKIGPLSGTAHYVGFKNSDSNENFQRNTLMIFESDQDNLNLILNQGNGDAGYIFVNKKSYDDLTISKYSYSPNRFDYPNELYIFQHLDRTYAFFTFSIFADQMLDSIVFSD